MRNKRLIATIASLVMVTSAMSTVSLNASAYGNASAENTTFSFNKYLVVDKNANVPNVDFTFTIAPDEDADTVHLTNNKVELYQGISGATFTDGTASFTTNSTTTAGGTAAVFTGNTNAETNITITSDTSKKYATDGLTVSFADVVFPESGIYRYKVTEADPTGAFTAETETDRTLDVYVEDVDGTLGIMGYVLYDKVITDVPTNYTTAEEATAGIGYNTAEVKGDNATGKKSSGFVNAYATHNLTFGKEVTGNQGSKDKYFEYTVTISGATPNDKYEVCVNQNIDGIIGNADIEVIANNATTVDGENVTSLTVGADGTITQKFYLHDGQYITICGLGEGVKYEITENAEDYTSKEGIAQNVSSLNWDGEEGFDALSDAVTNNTGITTDVYTGFTNDRSGTIPTGILLSVAAPATVGIVAVGGIAYLLLKNKRREDEEE